MTTPEFVDPFDDLDDYEDDYDSPCCAEHEYGYYGDLDEEEDEDDDDL